MGRMQGQQLEGPPTWPTPGAVAEGLGQGVGRAVFEGLADLVLVLGPDLTIEYANPVCGDVLGWGTGALLGRAMVDLVHPEDLARGLTAVRRAGSGQSTRAVPGAFRLGHADGSWRTVELNAGRVGEPGAQRTVLIGRTNHDPAIYDRLVGLLVDGAPLADAVALIPSFGAWRQPRVPFAIAYDGTGMGREVVGSEAGAALLRALVATQPWGVRPPDGATRRGLVAGLPATALVVAADHGVTRWVAVSRAATPGRTGALVVGWTWPDGPPLDSVERSVHLMARALDLALGWHEQRADSDDARAVDALTGLVDRPSFVRDLGDRLRRGGGDPVGVLDVHVDGVGAVNRAGGSAVGDAVLAEVADRLRGGVRTGDVLARTGGARFAVACSGLDAPVAAEALAHRVVDAVAEPILLPDGPAHVVAHVGVALTARHRTRPATADELLAGAEEALEVARGATGEGRVVVAPGVGGTAGAGAGPG